MLFLQTVIRMHDNWNSALQCSCVVFNRPASHFLGLFCYWIIGLQGVDVGISTWWTNVKSLSETSSKNISFFQLEMYLLLETIESQVDQFFITYITPFKQNNIISVKPFPNSAGYSALVSESWLSLVQIHLITRMTFPGT